MKKVLMVLLGVLVLAIAAAAIFIATFDTDRYRPLLIQKIEEAIGHPVSIDKVSLTLKGGLSAEISGLAIYETKGGAPVASLERAVATIRLMPLLKKNVEARSIILIKPSVEAVRAGGKLTIRGITQKAGSEKAGKNAAATAIFIGTVKIEDGQFTYIDASKPPITRLPIRDIDVTLKNVSLLRPLHFEARMAVMGERQNLSASGRITPPAPDRAALLENFKLDADLGGLDPTLLKQFVPALKSAEGIMSAQIDRLTLDEAGLGQAKAALSLNSGEVEFAGFKKPLSGIAMDAVAGENKIEIRQLSGTLGGGAIRIQGTAEQLKTRPRLNFEASAERMNLQDFIASAPGDTAQLGGLLSAYFRGSAEGMTGPALIPSLNGDGKVQLREGAVLNLNILREVFSHLSMIPGAAESLSRKLPPSYQEKLNARHTLLGPVDVPIAVRGGVIHLQPFQVNADDFIMTGQGSVTPDGIAQGQAMLILSPQLSEALVRSIKQLECAVNQGRLEIPVLIHGPLKDKRSLRPDPQFLQRIAACVGQGILTDLLNKKNEDGQSREKNILDSLFQ